MHHFWVKNIDACMELFFILTEWVKQRPLAAQHTSSTLLKGKAVSVLTATL